MRRSWQHLVCALVLMGAIPGVTAQQAPSPADLPARYRGGDIDEALQSQDWPRSEALLVAAIEGAPRERALLEVLGDVFLVQRKPLNAAIAFKKAEALAPLDDRARFALVLAYISLNRGDWARPELERLARSNPSNPTYEYWLGRLDYDGGDYASAIRRLEGVVARDPGFVRAYDNLGLCYEAQNEPERALAHYRKAVELNRAASAPSPWPPLNLGALLRQRGEMAAAETLLREAVSHDDSLAQAHHELGLVLEQADRNDEALSALTRAATLDPDYPAPHYALSRIHRRLGRPAESSQAMTTFEQLQEKRRSAAGQ